MTDFKEIEDSELEAVSGGTDTLEQRKEKVIKTIKALYPQAPAEIISKITDAIRSYGFKAAKALAQRLTKDLPLYQGIADLIPEL